MSRMNTERTLVLARRHVGNGSAMESSARLCLESAIQHYDYGRYDTCVMWTLKSLAYSVGVFHEDYKRVKSFADSLNVQSD